MSSPAAAAAAPRARMWEDDLEQHLLEANTARDEHAFAHAAETFARRHVDGERAIGLSHLLTARAFPTENTRECRALTLDQAGDAAAWLAERLTDTELAEQLAYVYTRPAAAGDTHNAMLRAEAHRRRSAKKNERGQLAQSGLLDRLATRHGRDMAQLVGQFHANTITPAREVRLPVRAAPHTMPVLSWSTAEIVTRQALLVAAAKGQFTHTPRRSVLGVVVGMFREPQPVTNDLVQVVDFFQQYFTRADIYPISERDVDQRTRLSLVACAAAASLAATDVRFAAAFVGLTLDGIVPRDDDATIDFFLSRVSPEVVEALVHARQMDGRLAAYRWAMRRENLAHLRRIRALAASVPIARTKRALELLEDVVVKRQRCEELDAAVKPEPEP